MNITLQAAEELRKVISVHDSPGMGIRIFSTKGCCGPSIQMDIATHPGTNEDVVALENIDFFVEKNLFQTLSPVTIEFGMNGFRFVGLKQSDGCCG
jgi:Fe-S cluster assembly iron-binding protein IscA